MGPAGVAWHAAAGSRSGAHSMAGTHLHHHTARGLASVGQHVSRDMAAGASMAAAIGAFGGCWVGPNMAPAGTHPPAQHTAPFVGGGSGREGMGRLGSEGITGCGRASAHDGVWGRSRGHRPASLTPPPESTNRAACGNSGQPQVCDCEGLHMLQGMQLALFVLDMSWAA